MANLSDYNLPRTNLFELLPERHQNDLNKAVMENLYNRFLTKDEGSRVIGHIGKTGDDTGLIQERTPHRQAFQLQPLSYVKTGSIESITSWHDLVSYCEAAGFDTNKINEWISSKKYNWFPPVDLDKLINYQNYYWYDRNNSTPQYVAIKSRAATAQARYAYLKKLADAYGSDFTIVSASGYQVTIRGDYVALFAAGFTVSIQWVLLSGQAVFSTMSTTVISSAISSDKTVITLSDQVPPCAGCLLIIRR